MYMALNKLFIGSVFCCILGPKNILIYNKISKIAIAASYRV
jgi:hypothetical protein